ncbi:hypothetical protein KFE25_010650 [Diacronema lutheri]|uniref:EF-hand domain-containing protein n=1 Tax=Diacronema lutheri TaxID=2081491 RepID=A0A8J6C5A4_DIALT|nr:hypothetical protein KFE25_010650 [Diacronema lutheri]
MGCGASTRARSVQPSDMPQDALAAVSQSRAPSLPSGGGAKPVVAEAAKAARVVGGPSPAAGGQAAPASPLAAPPAAVPAAASPANSARAAPPTATNPPELRAATSSILPKHVSADELGQLCQATNFDRKQVERLYEVFKVISSARDDDGLIDKGEFELALGLKSSLFVNRVFTIFDQNLDNNITFEEFVIGLSTFSARASREAKASMSFRIHDIDGDGIISRADLSKMLSATIAENALHISEEQFNALIATTFEQAGAADKHGLTLDDFLSLAKQRPAMLSNMTIASISVSR